MAKKVDPVKWAEAKATRDEEIAAARDPDTGFIDLDAVEAAKARWAKVKAALLRGGG